ncbi:MAG TPA: crosslink repair DNA glycosylase YcaQ family protein [Bryobacteraceae bacterium]|nr:crosslink repair DNA glycosylase YcaQ family protein [Bryobacteraceae bacterium]
MNEAKLKAWWSHRQGLGGRLTGQPAPEVLRETGWARSVAGSNPYLTLFARAQIGREAADRAVAKLEIHELPSARGCTYVLPACDFALGLKLAQAAEGGERKVALKLGATAAEIEKLCGAVVKALGKGPLDPDELKQAVGGAVRNFGPEGAKKGLTTTLPVALGELQSQGEIRRVPMNGRLDQQRYRYSLWRPNPAANSKLTREEAFAELARRYFHWIGPATLAGFQTFAGIGVKAAKEATAALGLVPAEKDSDHLLLPEDRGAFDKFQAPKNPQYSFVSVLDGISLLPPDDSGRPLTDGNPILDRGRLVGLWLYDPTAESIAWKAFVPESRALKDAVKQTENYVRTELGDVRISSQDSVKSRMKAIEALRKMK